MSSHANDPSYITEEALRQFEHDLATGFDGAAQWRRACTCGHLKRHHEQLIGRCGQGCSCRQYVVGQHEVLELWLHPRAAQWLPPWVHVRATGNRPDHDGHVQFVLVRDFDSEAVRVIRSGVRELTLRPEGDP